MSDPANQAGALLARIEAAFVLFEQITGGRRVRRDYYATQAWHAFFQEYNEEDLQRVVKRIQWQVREKQWPQSCLWFRNVVGDLDKFQEHLNDAQANARNVIKTPTPKDRALMDTHRPPVDTAPPDPQRVKHHLAKMLEAVNGSLGTEERGVHAASDTLALKRPQGRAPGGQQ